MAERKRKTKIKMRGDLKLLMAEIRKICRRWMEKNHRDDEMD